MFFIYYFSIIFVFQRGISELETNLFLYFCQQPVFDRSIAVNIVGGDACLAAVQELAEYDTLGRQFDIGAFFDDTGAFAAQFERDRGKVGGSLFHDLFSDALAPGKEDIVKMFC